MTAGASIRHRIALLAAVLVLGACAGRAVDALSEFDQLAHAFAEELGASDRAQCAQTHGRGTLEAQRCFEERAETRQIQLQQLREELERRRNLANQTMCESPVTGLLETCQEI